jgi:hypothetical protein
MSEGQQGSSYVAVILWLEYLDSLYLLTQKTDGGSLRRIGLADGHHSMDVRIGAKRAGKLTWLPGFEEYQFCNESKFRTVRLV